MDILFNVITDDVKLMWHNFVNKDSLERSVLNFCRSRTFTEVVVWFIKLQVWKLIIKKKGQKCRKAYYVLLQTLDGLFLEVDKVAVFFLSVIKLQMGKFLIKKKRPRGLLYKRPTSKSTKKKKALILGLITYRWPPVAPAWRRTWSQASGRTCDLGCRRPRCPPWRCGTLASTCRPASAAT